MKSFKKSSFVLGALALAGASLSACQTDKHAMVEPRDGTTIVCKECYDQIYKTKHSTGSRSGGNFSILDKPFCC